jgi:23S rRNA (guanine745-N1)-methyltransferase
VHPAVIAYLRCPLCQEPLAAPVAGTPVAGAPVAGALRCPRGHSFDQARAGYVHLTAGPLAHVGDTAPMLAARATLLGSGHFDAVTAALAAAAVDGWPGGLVVDVGSGTGRHVAGVLDALPDAWGLAIDAAKAAARHAARAHPRLDSLVCDAWRRLPLADASAGVVLNVFAPRNAAEFARVLRPDGVLLVVTPAADHLAELVGALALLRVDPDKRARLSGALDAAFARVRRRPVRTAMALHRADVATLVGMGPNAWHADPDALAGRIATLPDPVTVTLSVDLAVYRRRLGRPSDATGRSDATGLPDATGRSGA